MLTEQQTVDFQGWFDEMRLSFLKAVDTRDDNIRADALKRFRKAFRVLDEMAKGHMP